jgi:hypothetical protein
MNIEEVRGGGSDGERRCGPWAGLRKRMRRRGGVEETTAKVSECEDEKKDDRSYGRLNARLNKTHVLSHLRVWNLVRQVWNTKPSTYASAWSWP